MRRLLGIGAGILGVAACTAQAPAPVEDTVWQLVSIDGQDFSERAVLNLSGDGRVFGRAPCNSYAGEVSGVWPTQRFDRLLVTSAACPALEAERSYLDALAAMREGQVTDQGLLLRGQGREMLFRPVADG